jgi:hypothetical protein
MRVRVVSPPSGFRFLCAQCFHFGQHPNVLAMRLNRSAYSIELCVRKGIQISPGPNNHSRSACENCRVHAFLLMARWHPEASRYHDSGRRGLEELFFRTLKLEKIIRFCAIRPRVVSLWLV